MREPRPIGRGFSRSRKPNSRPKPYLLACCCAEQPTGRGKRSCHARRCLVSVMPEHHASVHVPEHVSDELGTHAVGRQDAAGRVSQRVRGDVADVGQLRGRVNIVHRFLPSIGTPTPSPGIKQADRAKPRADLSLQRTQGGSVTPHDHCLVPALGPLRCVHQSAGGAGRAVCSASRWLLSGHAAHIEAPSRAG